MERERSERQCTRDEERQIDRVEERRELAEDLLQMLANGLVGEAEMLRRLVES